MANQSLGLVNLPEEIVLQILRMVHDTPIPDFELRKEGYLAQEWALYNQGIRDIQNVRLTSRILSKVGSELLIEYVGVDLSWTSLYRFQRIMRHPGIRKGVGMVRIRLPVYDLKLCAYEEEYKSEQLGLYHFPTNHYPVDILGPEAKPFLHWLGESRQDCPEWTQEKVNTAIKRSHREYRYRYQSQVLLLSRRRKMFIQAVAEALKKSNNRALRVEITDRHDLPRQYRFVQSVQRAEEGNILDLYLKSPGSPRRWGAFAGRPGDRPRCLAPMVLEMLAAFQDERINIIDLKLEISMVTQSDREMFGKMVPEQEPLRGASAAMRNLRDFTYCHQKCAFGMQAPSCDQKTRPELSTLLYQCLPSSLRTLKLDSVEIEALQCRFPSLTQVTLESIMFEGTKDLEHFLQWVEPHEIAINLHDCSTFMALWADVLEFLRSKQLKTCLIKPWGGEFWQIERGWPRIWPLLSPDNAGPDMTKGSSANLRMRCFDQYVVRSQQYIRGDCDINPLRQRPN